MINTQSLWFRFPRTAFARETGPRITPIALIKMDPSNKPQITRMTRICFCRGSRARDAEAGRRRVGCDSTLTSQLSTINSQRSREGCHAVVRQLPEEGGFTPPKQRERVSAFTLIELLVVMAIIAILLLLVAPAFTNIKGGRDVTSAAYTIKGVLDTARTYAMANNTYTWVGFYEEDVSTASTNPATPGNGRVVMSIVASKDGTEVYTSVSSPAADMDSTGTRLSQVGKLAKIDNMHLRTFSNGTGTGDTFPTRPAIPGGSPDNAKIGNTSPPDSLRYFHYPANVAEAVAQYKFRKMVQFNPRGECRPQNDNYEMRVVMEVGFQPIHGTDVATVEASKDCAVQLTGVGGSTKIYQR